MNKILDVLLKSKIDNLWAGQIIKFKKNFIILSKSNFSLNKYEE